MSERKEIKEEHVDELWEAIMRKYKQGKIDEERMEVLKYFINQHIRFMHVSIKGACRNKACERGFWRLYKKYVVLGEERTPCREEIYGKIFKSIANPEKFKNSGNEA